MITELSDAIDCLYDTYHSQTGQLLEFGYSLEEAFWIHFASVSFMPWSNESQNLIPLSHILKFYAQIYRHEVAAEKNNRSKTFLKCLLLSRFNLAYALARQPRTNESTAKFALEIGSCTLPQINNTFKQALAGLFILSASPVSTRIDHRVSLGRLVCDIDRDNYIEKSQTGRFSSAPSCCPPSM